MISHIDPLVDSRWAAFVATAPHAWVTHLAAWKHVIESSFRHMEGHYFALTDGEAGPIQAALPVFEVRSRLIGHRLVSIPFATLSDPLVSKPEEIEELLTPVFDLARRKRCPRIEIRTTETAELFRDNRFEKRCDFVRHVLPLDAPAEALKKRFHRSCVRQKIEHALKSELRVHAAVDDRHLAEFERLHALTRQRLGLPPQPFRFFRTLFQQFAMSGQLTLFIATLGDRVAGGLILLHHERRASAEVIAEDILLRHFNVTHRLFWEAIKFSCQAGYEAFDFGRTAVTNTTLMEFKSRWGTESMTLPQFCYCPGAPSCRPQSASTRAARTLAAAIVRRSPLPVARLIGAVCYRHMG